MLSKESMRGRKLLGERKKEKGRQVTHREPAGQAHGIGKGGVAI
jgi:hypothetical protein